jgi:hypothetical protein
MSSTEFYIRDEVFIFSGQSTVDTWTLKDELCVSAGARYDSWLVRELSLMMQRIRDLADRFPFWQRRRRTGRPPVRERDLMVGFLLRQLFNTSFTRTQALMAIYKDYFRLERVPNHRVMSEKNRSKRWSTIWRRFHRFVLELLPPRKPVVATDATGFSGRKRRWGEHDYAVRARQSWVKMHAAVEVDSFFILSYDLSESNVHESQRFEAVWNVLPKNIEPRRSLADSAYCGERCLQIAREHGATPIHGVKRNAVYVRNPTSLYHRLVSFATHWPSRYSKMYGKRNHAETAFGMIQSCFGYRIRCRTDIGRKNEVHSKINAHNVRMLAKVIHELAD